jgi:hypothetical protein
MNDAINICWVVLSADEARLAHPAALALRSHGIRTIFVAAFSQSARQLYDLGERDVHFCPPEPADVAPVTDDVLREFDGRYPRPGLASLLFCEGRARFIDDPHALAAETVRHLRFWESFYEQHDIRAMLMWQSPNLIPRTGWAVAAAQRRCPLIVTHGPSFDHLVLADQDEEALWSELLEALQSHRDLCIDDGHRREVERFAAELTELHCGFQARDPGKARLIRPAWRWIRRRIVASLLPRRTKDARDASPEAVARFPDHPGEQKVLGRILAAKRRQYRATAWERRLRRTNYDAPVDGEQYVYFPMQNDIDVKLTVRNQFYTDQIHLATMLAGAVPPGTKLYVREHLNHPGMYDRRRLAALRKLSAVRLIDPRENNMQLTRGASAMVCVSSTAGWEAFLCQVPVVVLGRTFYSLSELAYPVERLHELPGVIGAALESGAARYRQRADDWVRFIHTVLHSCYPGSPFAYKKLFGRIEAKDLSANGHAIGNSIARKLRKALAQEPGDRKAA